MLGNLHVRFGVGAGVKSPGLHHFILARGGATYARLAFNAGPRASIELPVEVDFSMPFAASEFETWIAEYQCCVEAAIQTGLDALSINERQEDWWRSSDVNLFQGKEIHFEDL